MEFRILGPLEVVDGDVAVALGGVRQRTLLAILLLNANEVVSADRLIDGLWGERSPASGRSALQVRVSQLRKALGEGGAQLLTRASGYVLSLDSGQLDLQRFERLVGEAAAAEPRAAAEKLCEALALWRGPPLADLAYESFAQAAIGRLKELRVAAIEKRIDADLALGRDGELVAELEELVAEHPLREHPRAQLMLALYRCGRQADALEVYRRTSSELSAELGLEPGRELKELESAILNQDPSLEPSSLATGDSAGEPEPDREPLVEVEAPRRARKVVTVLFCDVTGSTALGEELDPEALFGVMSRYFEELRAIIERHGGTVAKFIGDAVMGVFGIPRVHEEDALRAVRAAAEIRTRLPTIAQEVGVELRFRTGVNTGLVLVGEGENLAIGGAVNVAARLEHAAQPGEILLGEATQRLVRDAVEVESLGALSLKGKSEPVAAFRLLAVDPLAPGLARRFDAPLIGRERELRAVRDAWNRAVSEAGCHLFTLLGPAGVGKSRLVAELLSDVSDEARVLAGRCLPYGEGITFWPLLEALTGGGEKTEAVLERLRSGGTATPHELFLEVRLTLELLAGDRPVLVHVDDLQWAEPLLLDLLDHIVELSRDAPILLLCTARPELLEDRPAWGGGKLNATTMMLEPLATAECEALLAQLGDDLDPRARARVVSASEGNPLFLEEMSALARETGSHAVPSTIQALLAARLERLAGAERELLERGRNRGRGLSPRDRATARGRRAVGGRDRRVARRTRSQGSDPPARPDSPERPSVQIPPSADPRRGVRQPAQGRPSRAPRAPGVRARTRGARPDRAGRDRRMAPRAGHSLPAGARSGRLWRSDRGRQRASLRCRAACARAQRRDGREEPPRARASARAGGRHPSRSHRARPRRATDRGRGGRPGGRAPDRRPTPPGS